MDTEMWDVSSSTWTVDFSFKYKAVSGVGHIYWPSCSSILSHSSRMKCLIWHRFRVLLHVSARIWPGVPTTMWGESFFSTSSSFFIDSPPKNTATCRQRHAYSLSTHSWFGLLRRIRSEFTLTVGMYFENLSYSLLIWQASSLVWHITRTDTCSKTMTHTWSSYGLCDCNVTVVTWPGQKYFLSFCQYIIESKFYNLSDRASIIYSMSFLYQHCQYCGVYSI